MVDQITEVVGLKEGDAFHLGEISDGPEMIDVGMNAFGITTGSSPNPMLKTVGAATCVALALYDSETKTAGLAHIPPATSRERIVRDVETLLSAMHRNGTNLDLNSLKAYAFGGLEERLFSQWVGEILKEKGVRDLTQKRSDRNSPNYGYDLGIDSRTGEVFSLTDVNFSGVMPQERISGNTIHRTSDKRSLA